MSRKNRKPYDPYRQKQNIPVLYIRYSRDAVKQQNRRFWGVSAPAVLSSFGFLCMAGIAQDAASPALKQALYHIAMPACGLLAATLWIAFLFVCRKAYQEGWIWIYSDLEQALIENRLPIFRTPEQQDSADLSKGAAYVLPPIAAGFLIAAVIWSLFQ